MGRLAAAGWELAYVAVAGLPWVFRHRNVVPDHVEAGLRLLDRSQLHSGVRQYVS